MAENRSNKEYLTAAQFGGRFGVTARALRVYEQAGLLTPGRTAAGWRVYGPEEADRLYQILALKTLGLSLTQIGEALRGADLARILAVQEAALHDTLDRARSGLTLVRAARARLENGATLSADDLVTLSKETAMTATQQNDRYVALVERHFGPRVEDAMPTHLTLTEMAALRQDWLALIAEGEKLRDGDPASAEAQEYLRRLEAVIDRTVRDEADRERHAALFAEGYSDARTAAQMPFSPELYAFIQEARAHGDAMEGAV